jgi:hypothetical protein
MPMYEHITDEQADLLSNAEMFFVASVAPDMTLGRVGEGPVNLSPKGGRVLVVDDHTLAYLDYKGSGNETARHGGSGGPVTVMAMSVDEDAAIVRCYGQASAEPIDVSAHARALLEDTIDDLNRRQVIVVDVTSTQTSCGYGVPRYDFVGHRDTEHRGRRYKTDRS